MRAKTMLILSITMIIIMLSIIKPSPSQAQNNKVVLQNYTFNTITTNLNGSIKEKKEGQAKVFVENLFVENLLIDVPLEMVEIPGGSFMMGTPTSQAGYYGDNAPQHQVNIKSFYIGKYEVTQGQWQAIMGTKPDFYGQNLADNFPIAEVSWKDAVEFCKKLSEKTGKEYRLPTEAEWEYACRAGKTTSFAYGENITPELANYDGRAPYGAAPIGEYRGRLTAVGSFPPNNFGLYDMHGNAWEWCLDVYHSNYKGAPKDGSAWLEGGSNERVLRGGSWLSSAFNCRPEKRFRNAPDGISVDVGFRVVTQTP